MTYRLYVLYMGDSVSAASARQHWSETIDKASREPVSITRHGREAVVLMNAELAERALEALEDAEDLKAAREARAEGGSIPWEEVKADLGLE
ncbi:type II toxin-antitoxin system Phd/YefM family antitoxin [Arthrobacter sp. VKM Ac-2550]|nr:type II toxin-antitoxin system Phd/YefM family antitoxin [Arthrobacter sp. VKM Ac-2550]MCW2134424.1 prevent-host-death family protein [Arthrobacter sp. VKM Ac-2550]